MPTILPPTRGERLMRALAYLFTAGVGLYTVTHPPASVTLVLGQALSMIWALMMLAGIPAAYFTLRSRFRGEYACLASMNSALAVAIIASWLHAMSNEELIPRVAIASALCCLFTVRFFTLHRLASSTPAFPLRRKE